MLLPELRGAGDGRMSEETIWTVAWLVIGFIFGFASFAIYALKQTSDDYSRGLEDGYRIAKNGGEKLDK